MPKIRGNWNPDNVLFVSVAAVIIVSKVCNTVHRIMMRKM